MKKHRMNKPWIAVLLAASYLLGASSMSQADETLQAILKVGADKNVAAAKSQVKIDKLAEQTRSLLTDYKTVSKQIDGLKVYNTRLQRQIDNQIRRIGDIEESISQVSA